MEYEIEKITFDLDEGDITKKQANERILALFSDRLSLQVVAKEMYQAINYTLSYPSRKNRKKDDYTVSFLYPANNLSYQKLLKASNEYNKFMTNPQ